MHKNTMFAIAAVSVLSIQGCVNAPIESLATPVTVKVPDYDLTTEEGRYKATHVKIGARWFPRCVAGPTLGTRFGSGSSCLSDDEIIALDQHTGHIREVIDSGVNILPNGISR